MQVQPVGDQFNRVFMQVPHLFAQSDFHSGRKAFDGVRYVFRAADVGQVFSNRAFQKGNQPTHQRQHDRHAHGVEYRVEDCQFQGKVIGRNADARADPVHRLAQRGNQRQRDPGGDQVEHQMRQRQAPPLKIRCHGADNGGDRCADIGPDR